MQIAKITKKQSTGKDEMYCEWFSCPSCKKKFVIQTEWNYCPNCGIKLEFSKSIKKEN